MESFRGSMLEKSYLKIFALAIFLIILGIIIITVGNLYTTFVEIDTPDEYDDYLKTIGTLGSLSGLTLQLGMVLFSLSAFWGGVVDKTLSEEVRRGLVFAASMAIIALAVVMVFSNLFY